VAVAVSSCGSYTERQFAARADAICIAAVRQERSLAPPSFSGSAALKSHSLATYLARVLPIVESEARRLRRLPRPSQSAHHRAALAAYLHALDQATAGFQALAGAAATGDPQRLQAAEAALASTNLTGLAAAGGLTGCATPGATIG
jgi:hypothetical protein